ncbi:MAG: efflux RND transporter periplasmic adaptor subunit [Magnetococcales bacterium]|nr:efflux RND transporter periplasmic adaptor subunit [Magnetococcales bacterium]
MKGPLALLLTLAIATPLFAEDKPAAPPPPEVEMSRAARRTIPIMQDIPGRTLPTRTAQVRARTDGIVEKRLFNEGIEVAAGTLLYQLDNRMQKALVQSAEATLEKNKAENMLAKQTLERHQHLITTNAVSQQELDQATAQSKKAAAEEAIARANLVKAKIDLEYTTITAPISGRIGRSLVTEGALVGKGEATHLATSEQLNPIQVSFTQSSSDLLNFRREKQQGTLEATDNASVKLLFDNGQPYSHTGKLLFSETTIDPQTGAVLLRAEFPNPDSELLPGLFVKILLEIGQTNGITVPQRAVQTSPQGQAVFMVDKDNKVFLKPIKTGGFSGKDWIVREGVQEGEGVIVNGLQKIRPGSIVSPKYSD